MGCNASVTTAYFKSTVRLKREEGQEMPYQSTDSIQGKIARTKKKRRKYQKENVKETRQKLEISRIQSKQKGTEICLM